jgi:fructosamine-3-kinase
VIAITAALQSLGLGPYANCSPLAGGCIHDVQRVRLVSGDQLVCKVAGGGTGRRMLESEHRGLQAMLDAQVVHLPEVLGLVDGDDSTVLVLEYLPRAATADWAAAGREMAAMHRLPMGHRYGCDQEVWLGGTCLAAGWDDDWCVFLGERRLRPLVRDVVDMKAVDAATGRHLDRVIDQLHTCIPSQPHASLLHGDLWAGNLYPTEGGRVAMLDPAVSVGDAVADPAMTLLFGGTPEVFVHTWHEEMGELPQAQERIAAAQMLHLLNHVRLFGAGYVPRLMEVVEVLAV